MTEAFSGNKFTEVEQEAIAYAEHTWAWVFADLGNVEQLDPRDPHGAVEDVLVRIYNCDLQRAQTLSSFALSKVLQISQ